MVRLLALVGVGLLMVAVAGCGGEDAGTGTPPERSNAVQVVNTQAANEKTVSFKNGSDKYACEREIAAWTASYRAFRDADPAAGFAGAERVVSALALELDGKYKAVETPELAEAFAALKAVNTAAAASIDAGEPIDSEAMATAIEGVGLVCQAAGVPISWVAG